MRSNPALHKAETTLMRGNMWKSGETEETKERLMSQSRSKDLLQQHNSTNEVLLTKLFDIFQRLHRVPISSPNMVNNDDSMHDQLIINLGRQHAALILYFQSWDENAQETLKVFQCVKKLEDVMQFLLENENSLMKMSDSTINRTTVNLFVASIDNIRNYMDINEDIDPLHDFVKPALLTAAELGEYELCSTLIEQKIPCHLFLLWHFSGRILAHLCLSNSEALVTDYVKSCPFPLDIADALVLAYEKQKVDIFEFIVALKIPPLEVKVKDFSLVIQQAVNNLDAAFLKYLHEKGMDAIKLIHPITAANVASFLQACFALKFANGHVFPIDRSSALTVFVPACLEALIRHCTSPLTCVNSVLKTSPSSSSDTHPTPNLIYLFTEIMKDDRYDASIVQILMQLWHVAMAAAKRVEEEQEDLRAFCGQLETVVLEVFACDTTNVDVNLIPLVKMRHDKSHFKDDVHATASTITSTKDVHWIFGVNSIVRHAIDRNFKILFAVPQINRLIVHIFNSARQDFHHHRLHFQERFHPMILFYIQMLLRAMGFILLAKIVILDYTDASARAFSFNARSPDTGDTTVPAFVPFSRWEIFLSIFLLSEILEELGQLYEIQEEMGPHHKRLRSSPMDHVSTAGNAPSTVQSLFNNTTLYSLGREDADDDERDGDHSSMAEDLSPIFIEHHGVNTFVSSSVSAESDKTKPSRTLYGGLYRQMSITAQVPDNHRNHVGPAANSSTRQKPPSLKLNPTTSTSSSASSSLFPSLLREPSAIFTRSVSRSLSSRVNTSEDDVSDPLYNSSKHHTQSHAYAPPPQRHKLLKRRRRHWAILREYFSDEWNFLDVTNAGMGMLWFVLRCLPSRAGHARIVLSLLAIPWSLRMLRFLSINKTLGELVIIIKAMVMDVMAFLFVYVLMIIGFSVAFRGLFSDVMSFHSNGDTFLSLFSATMSNFGFQEFDSRNEVVNVIGTVLTIVFVVMTAVLLMNLLIARMSNSFQRISENSQMEWAFERAKMVRSLTLIREKPVWNILPAPLNLIPIVLNGFGLLDLWIRHQAQRTEKMTHVSIRGTVANLTLFVVCFPCLKVIDVVLAFGQTFLWTKEEPMSSLSFLWFLLQAIVELITYIPLLFVWLLVALCLPCCPVTRKNETKHPLPASPWMSYVHMKDGCIVLQNSETPPDDSPPKMSVPKTFVDSKTLPNKKSSFGLFANSTGSKSFSFNNGMIDALTSSTHLQTFSNSRDSNDKTHANTSALHSMPLASSFSFDLSASRDKDRDSTRSHIFGDQDIELILKSLRQKCAPLPKEEHLAQFHQLQQALRSLQEENRDIKSLLQAVLDQGRYSHTIPSLGTSDTINTTVPISPSSGQDTTSLFSMQSNVSNPSGDNIDVKELSMRSSLSPCSSSSLTSPSKQPPPLYTCLTGIPVVSDPIDTDDEEAAQQATVDIADSMLHRLPSEQVDGVVSSASLTNEDPISTPSQNTQPAVATSSSTSVTAGNVWWDPLHLTSNFS